MRIVSTLLLVATAAPQLCAQAAPTVTAAACADPARRAVPVDIPVTLQSNHFVITACRGERALSFVLDTGAPTSLFDLTVAKELGIETGQPVRSGGAGAGTINGALLRRDSVRLAGTDVVAPIAMALDFSALNARGRLKIDGILGADFIDRYVLGLDYRGNVLRLHDAKTFSYAGQGAIVPFTMTNRFIYVKGDVGLPDGSHVPGRFVVDVGASSALSLAKPFVDANHLRDRVGKTIRREGGHGVGGASMADFARVPTFSIGDVTLTHPIVTMYGDSAGVFSSSTLGDGNIGGEILRRFTVLLDYSRKQMIFERHSGTEEPFEIDMTGLALVPNPNASGLLVESIAPSSPAAHGGFAVGDTVLAIDGRPATMAEVEAMRARFHHEGESLAYTVRRGDTEVVLHLVTRRMM
jgi:hypothetical protein